MELFKINPHKIAKSERARPVYGLLENESYSGIFYTDDILEEAVLSATWVDLIHKNLNISWLLSYFETYFSQNSHVVSNKWNRDFFVNLNPQDEKNPFELNFIYNYEFIWRLKKILVIAYINK